MGHDFPEEDQPIDTKGQDSPLPSVARDRVRLPVLIGLSYVEQSNLAKGPVGEDSSEFPKVLTADVVQLDISAFSTDFSDLLEVTWTGLAIRFIDCYKQHLG